MDVVAIAVLAIGLVVSAMDHFQSERSIRTLRGKSDYSDVARLNTQGKPFPDGDIAFNSALSRMMEGTYKLDGNTFFFYRSPEAEAQSHRELSRFSVRPLRLGALHAGSRRCRLTYRS